jgi:hypothetical protein
MSTEVHKAKELYSKYGLKKANFIAFNEMQKSTEMDDVDFWLKVINQIALLDIQSLDENDVKQSNKWGHA